MFYFIIKFVNRNCEIGSLLFLYVSYCHAFQLTVFLCSSGRGRNVLTKMNVLKDQTCADHVESAGMNLEDITVNVHAVSAKAMVLNAWVRHCCTARIRASASFISLLHIVLLQMLMNVVEAKALALEIVKIYLGLIGVSVQEVSCRTYMAVVARTLTNVSTVHAVLAKVARTPPAASSVAVQGRTRRSRTFYCWGLAPWPSIVQ